ncbi:MAG: ROK family protein [Luteitalea sp.]|nr:ROK family protein [Acidobacteriota bacterium]
MTGVAIGIDIGGTYTKLVAVSDAGEILARARLPTDDSAASRLPASTANALARLETIVGPAAAVGVACPGLVRSDGVAVHWMKGRLDVLEGLDWTAALQRRAPVRVVNDAQAALKGESWLGAGRGCRDVVMLTLGTGVGGAIMSGGRVLTGNTGRAGHLGHIALQVPGDKDIVNTPGSLEDAIGNCTVRRRSHGRFESTEALVDAYAQGDPIASQVWQGSVMRLAAALASIVNAVDPARIILGGGIAVRAGDLLMAPLRTWMDEYEWRPHDTGVEIVVAELGDEAGAIGAARHAMEQSA